jgi:lysophospholipase L1-like esterase
MYTVPFYMKPLKSTQVMLSALEELNQGILDVAADEGVEVIDCETVLQGMNAEDVLAPDNVHLSEKAYEALFSEIQDD